MAKFNYTEEAETLSKAIDIAIESLQKFPPKGFNDNHLNHFVNVYLDFKHQALNPGPQYKNSRSFSYVKNDVFTYFQEGAGDAVNYFWKQVNEQNLGYKRENKLAKILKRQKIKNQIEYDFVIDVLVPYQQEGLISESDVDTLNKMILEYERKTN